MIPGKAETGTWGQLDRKMGLPGRSKAMEINGVTGQHSLSQPVKCRSHTTENMATFFPIFQCSSGQLYTTFLLV